MADRNAPGRQCMSKMQKFCVEKNYRVGQNKAKEQRMNRFSHVTIAKRWTRRRGFKFDFMKLYKAVTDSDEELQGSTASGTQTSTSDSRSSIQRDVSWSSITEKRYLPADKWQQEYDQIMRKKNEEDEKKKALEAVSKRYSTKKMQMMFLVETLEREEKENRELVRQLETQKEWMKRNNYSFNKEKRKKQPADFKFDFFKLYKAVTDSDKEQQGSTASGTQPSESDSRCLIKEETPSIGGAEKKYQETDENQQQTYEEIMRKEIMRREQSEREKHSVLNGYMTKKMQIKFLVETLKREEKENQELVEEIEIRDKRIKKILSRLKERREELPALRTPASVSNARFLILKETCRFSRAARRYQKKFEKRLMKYEVVIRRKKVEEVFKPEMAEEMQIKYLAETLEREEKKNQELIEEIERMKKRLQKNRVHLDDLASDV